MSPAAGTEGRPEPAGGGSSAVAAVIDVGSNSALLLTVEVGGDGRARALDEAVETTRLGTGLAAGGRLDPGARATARAVVGRFAARARAAGADPAWAFATGAVRDAADGPAFARELEETAGVPVEVLTGAEEARLAYAAVAHALGAGQPLLAVDVGGRTTELTLGTGERPAETVSLPLGALTLTERVREEALSGAKEPERLRAAIDAVLARSDVLARARGAHARTVVSGGTATAVAALDLGLTAYAPRRVHGHAVSAAALARLVDALAALPARARSDLPGLEPGRGAIVLAGATVLCRLAAALGGVPLTVSAHGVRHGYLRDRLRAVGCGADLRELWR